MRQLGVRRRALTDDEYERIGNLISMSDLGSCLETELGGLVAEQREALRLRIVDERSYSHISRELGISEQTARTRVSKHCADHKPSWTKGAKLTTHDSPTRLDRPILTEVGDALYAAAAAAEERSSRSIPLRQTLLRHDRRAWVRRRVALSAALVGVAGAGGAGLVYAGSAAPQNSPAAVKQLNRNLAALQTVSPAVSTVDAAQSAHFAVLTTAGPSPSARITALMTRTPLITHFGGNVALARPIGSEGDAWVVPGDGEICLLITDEVGGATDCATDAQAIAGDLSGSLLSGGPNPTEHIVGLLPDGATSVNLVAVGRATPVSAVANGWEVTLPDGPHQLTFTMAGTSESVPTP
jgi:hypothetical protein